MRLHTAKKGPENMAQCSGGMWDDPLDQRLAAVFCDRGFVS
jgi:hypothetical protein